MSYQFFPNNQEKLNYVMRIYEEEINNRNDWIKENAEQLNSSFQTKSASVVINYAIGIINHAMLVVRLVDIEAIGSRNKQRSKERAKLIHERNPGLPNPPSSLRLIRHDYEHFEERLDEWATQENPNTFVDLTVGGGIMLPQQNTQDTFRQLEETTLKFWNHSIDLQEVVTWVDEMSCIVVKNNRERF
ncbi:MULTISPECIES: hypothetical protein [Bacillaceae]|uniref:Uncharacterized protein n=1 Tax=Evansella alkalicola TaxID=745819 RepID=A0ABS6JX35_9BACI|nr:MULTISPECIES: hypothetical protein [Bacillaceae]MBU9723063.1 hypothetical protein [Bacillus alkalicola]